MDTLRGEDQVDAVAGEHPPSSALSPATPPQESSPTAVRNASAGAAAKVDSAPHANGSQFQAPSFAPEITLFTQQIESLASSLPLVIDLVREAAKKAHAELITFLETAADMTQVIGEKKTFTIPGEQVSRFLRLKKSLTKSQHAFLLIPRSFVVSLVSQYDSYLGRLVRVVLLTKPEILNASERNLSFSDLVRLGSVDQAREFLIEQEVESVIRQSHSEQFNWFENKLKIPLRKGLGAWPSFIEVTERRNLFVHCDGVVSSQYLDVCSRHDVVLDATCTLGTKLHATSDYFAKAFECVYEVGVKLGQVLWRKLLPTDLEKADTNLNNVCLDLIVSGNYKLATRLLDFATDDLKKHADENSRRIFVINRAQAYKWLGANDKCLSILEGEDWSASSDKFQLGVAVLRDDFEAASRFIKYLVEEPSFPEAYKEWPLFGEFRKSAKFQKAYEEAYHKPFGIEEVTAPTEKLECVPQEGNDSLAAISVDRD